MRTTIISLLAALALAACGGSDDSTSYTGAGTFKATGSMTSSRSMPTATLLVDGRVLIAGGSANNGDALASAELYNPPTRTFSATGSMAVRRVASASVQLKDGRVMVVGGQDASGDTGKSIASVELYNPVTGTWSFTGSMNTSRLFPSITLLPSGKVLVVGGFTGDTLCCATATAELYDPASGTFSYTGSMATARRTHAQTLLIDGRVLVAGGWNESAYLDSPVIYDSATKNFSATGSMGTTRRFPTGNLLLDGTVLITGGFQSDSVTLASAVLYNILSKTFSTTGSMLAARARHTGTLLNTGKVLVAGGNNQVDILATAELYDPVSRTFSATGSMTTPRWRHTETLLLNGTVLMTGGVDNNDTKLASAEIYTPP